MRPEHGKIPAEAGTTNGVRVSGQIETIEDLKNTSKYDTVWTLEEEMTATGPNNYHGSGERYDSKVTDIDASERSIRTTTVIGSTVPATETTPEGSTLVETVTLELPVEDNTTTFNITREGTYGQRSIGLVDGTSTVKVTAIEGSYEASDIGTTTNSVIDGTITTTRHADGHISVTGSIWAKTRTVADALASGNSTWVEGLKFGAVVNPPGQGDLLTMSDEALDAAGDGSQSSTGQGSGASGFGDFDRFDVGVVVSRDINAHYVEEDNYKWIRDPDDPDGDGVNEWVKDTGPIYTHSLVVTGTDDRVIHHYGNDEIGPYGFYVTGSGLMAPDIRTSHTDIGAAENPSGFVGKAQTFIGDNSKAGRIPDIDAPGDGTGDVDDSSSSYAPPNNSGGGQQEGGEGEIGAGGTRVDLGDFTGVALERTLEQLRLGEEDWHSFYLARKQYWDSIATPWNSSTIKGSFWAGYFHYLTNPGEMDDGWDTAFYYSGGIGGGALILAGGAIIVTGGTVFGSVYGGTIIISGGFATVAGYVTSWFGGRNIVAGGVIGAVGRLSGGAAGGLVGTGTLTTIILGGALGEAAESGITSFANGDSSTDVAINTGVGGIIGGLTAGLLDGFGRYVVPYIKKAWNSLFSEAIEGKLDDVVEAVGSVNGAGLRQQYTDAVADLKNIGDELLRNGVPEEEVARTLHNLRRQLGVKFKDATPPDLLDFIHRFNVDRYGDRLGPTFDSLRAKGKTFGQIIESAPKPLGDAKDLGAALLEHFGDEILPLLVKYDMLR